MDLMKIAFLLIIAINIGATVNEEQHRPCIFNTLCTCSNAGPELGSVNCHNIPFSTIPVNINNSKIYIMSLKNNMLQNLEENGLNGTEIWKLQIAENLLTDLPTKAFGGLEKTLSSLDMNHNQFVRIPKDAIQSLEKLQTLILAKNNINRLESDDTYDLRKHLKVLDLSGNSLIYIHSNAFRNMEALETLNLASNSIISVDLFQTGANNLKQMNLMENQLERIPLNTLSSLKSLQIVNLNYNFISVISDSHILEGNFFLDELHLEHNLLEQLDHTSFKSFLHINKIFLNGNPLKMLKDKAFSPLTATEIYLSDCLVSYISKFAYQGVENSLQVLDLSFNNLTNFPDLQTKRLKVLKLQGNKIHFIPKSAFNAFQTALQDLDVSGSYMTFFPANILQSLPNIRQLNFNKEHNSVISKDDFLGIGPTLEKLNLIKNHITFIENEAFSHLPGLKHLDLSYNNIKSLGNASFKEIEHSLESLVLHNSLSMTVYPTKALQYLKNLKYLDLSSNKLAHFSPESLISFYNLRFLNLNHNNLKDFNFILRSRAKNPNLCQLKLAFNRIHSLETNNFNNLRKLEFLLLNDNQISVIQRSAFVDLVSLVYLNLEGNYIKDIKKEAFQNLPRIRLIKLSYNKLLNFNLEAFDQVGRLSTLQIEADHNNIQKLSKTYNSEYKSRNIKILNFSYNNITDIASDYFDPVKRSLYILDLSNNKLENLTNAALSHMEHLRVLLISSNKLQKLSPFTLNGLNQLQILDISNNNISDLNENLFQEQINLRILKASNNKIVILHSISLKMTVLELLDLSWNKIDTFPEDSLNPVNSTLQDLNLSGNKIYFLNATNLQYLRNLKQLKLSENCLQNVDLSIFKFLPKLTSLDLSHNDLEMENSSVIIDGPHSLRSINLAQTGLTLIPSFEVPHILSLNLSQNMIQKIQHDELNNLSKIQVLDLSYNKIEISDVYKWNNLPYLRSLHLSGNPIQVIKNDSFANLKQLQELFIKDLQLQNIESSAFFNLISLRKVETRTYPDIKNVNIAGLLSHNRGLQAIHLHIQENFLLNALKGELPKSLKEIELEGHRLEKIEKYAFQSVNSRELTLRIHDTNVTTISLSTLIQGRNGNLTIILKNNKLKTLKGITKSSKIWENRNQIKQLDLPGNQLYCDCNLAWIREWIDEYEYNYKCNEIDCNEKVLRSLRNIECMNKNNYSIIDILKTDLQCSSNGWSKSMFKLTYNFLIIECVIAILITRVL